MRAGTSASIIDSRGNVWTITSSGQVAVNGTTDTSTSGASLLAYANGVVWQQNTAGDWYSDTALTPGEWGSGSNPLPFAILGPAWAAPLGSTVNPITWSFGDPTVNTTAQFSHAITNPAQQKLVENAIQTWATQTGLNFTEVANSASAAPDILIGFGSFNSPSTGILGQTNYSWSGPSGGPENMNAGAVVRIEDPAEDTTTTDANGQQWYTGVVNVSLEQDAMHEFGHALGLASNPVDHNAVMYDGLGGSNPTLDPNDVQAIKSLYPSLTAPGSDTLLSASGGSITPDKLSLLFSEDAYQGNAQFIAKLDGTQIGAGSVAALHSAGQAQSFTHTGSWGPGLHDLEIDFTNDAYGGSPTADRNLYVNGVTYDGSPAMPSGSFVTMDSNGAVHLAVGHG